MTLRKHWAGSHSTGEPALHRTAACRGLGRGDHGSPDGAGPFPSPIRAQGDLLKPKPEETGSRRGGAGDRLQNHIHHICSWPRLLCGLPCDIVARSEYTPRPCPALQAAYHTGHLGSPHLRESTSGDLSDTNVRGDLVCSGRLPRGPRK